MSHSLLDTHINSLYMASLVAAAPPTDLDRAISVLEFVEEALVGLDATFRERDGSSER